MVAAVATPQRSADVRLVTEIRGAPARLWDEASGEIVISGPAGTGKTRAILEWIHRRCSTEKIRVLILRKTQESLKASAMVTFQDQVLHEFDGKQSIYDGVDYFGGNNLRPPEFTYLATGSKILMSGMDRASKVLSTEWDVIYVNEATELTLEEWEELTGRVDRPKMQPDDQVHLPMQPTWIKPPSVVVGDCNPDAPTHWIMQRANQGKLKLWYSRHEDNPAMWDRIKKQWTEAGRVYLERLNNLTGVRYLRKRLGKWVAAEGQIYEGWDAEVHVIDTYNGKTRNEIAQLDWPHFWDVDFGFTNPFVWHDVVMDPDGRLIVVDEIYRTQVLVEDHAANIMQRTQGRPRPKAIITDHDAEDRATFERKTGLRTIAAVKEVSPGLQAVASRLRPAQDAKPRLYIFRDACPPNERDRSLIERGKPSCTAEEFPTYVWDTRQGVKKGEAPLKEDDHGMDGVRYQVMHHDGRTKGRAWGFG